MAAGGASCASPACDGSSAAVSASGVRTPFLRSASSLASTSLLCSWIASAGAASPDMSRGEAWPAKSAKSSPACARSACLPGSKTRDDPRPLSCGVAAAAPGASSAWPCAAPGGPGPTLGSGDAWAPFSARNPAPVSIPGPPSGVALLGLLGVVGPPSGVALLGLLGVTGPRPTPPSAAAPPGVACGPWSPLKSWRVRSSFRELASEAIDRGDAGVVASPSRLGSSRDCSGDRPLGFCAARPGAGSFGVCGSFGQFPLIPPWWPAGGVFVRGVCGEGSAMFSMAAASRSLLGTQIARPSKAQTRKGGLCVVLAQS